MSYPYSKANNPDCPEYDPKILMSLILYTDVNNSYGDPMSQFLLICTLIGRSFRKRKSERIIFI